MQETIATSLGGETVTATVEGRERYTVNVRYLRGLRNDPQAIATQVLVQGMNGPAVPLGQVASVRPTQGPPMLRTENAQLVNYIYVDMHDRDICGYVDDARRSCRRTGQRPVIGFGVDASRCKKGCRVRNEPMILSDRTHRAANRLLPPPSRAAAQPSRPGTPAQRSGDAGQDTARTHGATRLSPVVCAAASYSHRPRTTSAGTAVDRNSGSSARVLVDVGGAAEC